MTLVKINNYLSTIDLLYRAHSTNEVLGSNRVGELHTLPHIELIDLGLELGLTQLRRVDDALQKLITLTLENGGNDVIKVFALIHYAFSSSSAWSQKNATPQSYPLFHSCARDGSIKLGRRCQGSSAPKTAAKSSGTQPMYPTMNAIANTSRSVLGIRGFVCTISSPI